MEVRLTGKGHAIDLGTVYAYIDRQGGPLNFWAQNLSSTTLSADELVTALSNAVQELKAQAEANPRWYAG